MNIKILTPGDKLRLLRKKYNLKQDELSGTYITRNMISMIETNKAALNPATAKVLLDNLYSICSQKNLECTVTLDDLLESPNTQVKAIALEFLKSLLSEEDLIMASLQNGDYMQVVILLDQHDLIQEKALLYETVGNYYMHKTLYQKAFHYYAIAFESIRKTLTDDTFPSLTLRIMECCYKLKNFPGALQYSRFLFIYQPKISDDILYKIKHYSILCRYHLHEYEQTLSDIDLYLDKFYSRLKKDSDDRIKLLLLKGDCLKQIHRYPEALNIYQQILRSYDLALEFQIITTLPIIHIHIETQNMPLAKALLKETLPLVSTYEKVGYKDYLIEIYKGLAKLYTALEDTNCAIEYYYKALDHAKLQLNATVTHELVLELLLRIPTSSYAYLTKLLTYCIELIELKLILDTELITELIILCHRLQQPALLNQLLTLIKDCIKTEYKNKDYL